MTGQIKLLSLGKMINLFHSLNLSFHNYYLFAIMKQKHSVYGEFALVLAVVINSFGVVRMH